MPVSSTHTKEKTMTIPHLSHTTKAAAHQPDPHEIGWQEVRDLGLDPAPAGLTEEDDETAQA
jgi:hypothetical protein